ncbi:hypothetical protein PR048_015082 [Dryococelus australis]|uniref:Uncharacterized protein n=1 Tax=Dryococelus australis TaxID=614101 RepID=A0ABQ9HG05_9NEOP|nr:hypothetical protein PR048_015082 [Dryococelus australis]
MGVSRASRCPLNEVWPYDVVSNYSTPHVHFSLSLVLQVPDPMWILHRPVVFNPRPGHSGFSHVGIVPDDAVGRWVFSGISRFPRSSFPRRFIPTSITLIGSQDLDVKSHPNLFTRTPSLSPHISLADALAITPRRQSDSSRPSPHLAVENAKEMYASRYGSQINNKKKATNLEEKLDPLDFQLFTRAVQERVLLVHEWHGSSEVSMERRRDVRVGETGDPRENPPGVNPGSPWLQASALAAVSFLDGNTARLACRSDEALGARVSVARIAPSLLDLGRADTYDP